LNRLALGTAQIGLDYGVSNRRGLVPRGEVAEILALAAAAGVDTLDTAQAYGSSEEAIGGALKAAGAKFRIVTKLKDVPAGGTEPAIAASLGRTGAGAFYGVLLHSFDEYEASPAKYDALLAAKRKGFTLKTGFSLYHPAQAEKLLAAGVSFDLVQVPYNLLDRRFARVFPALKRAGVEIHARSVFLQGALLMPPEELPPALAALRPKTERLRAWAAGKGLAPAAACLAFVLSAPEVDRAVIGVDSKASFAANLESLRSLAGGAAAGVAAELGGLEESDERLILPQNWIK
jgi:aryl-alcohol dehydrogenase-like predicted oxidoreductase